MLAPNPGWIPKSGLVGKLAVSEVPVKQIADSDAPHESCTSEVTFGVLN